MSSFSRNTNSRSNSNKRTASLLLILLLFCLWIITISRMQGSVVLDYDGGYSTIPTTAMHQETDMMLTMKKATTTGRQQRQQQRDDERQLLLSSTSGTSNNNNNKKEKDKVVRFVFAIGLEGTGHHFMRKLLRQTPAFDLVINQLGATRQLVQFQNSIYTSKGLMYLHCGINWPKENDGNTTAPDVESVYQDVVTKLKDLQSAVLNVTTTTSGTSTSSHDDETITIPINAFGKNFQMASYPQDNDSCRQLKYPNIDVLYSACHDAGVQCYHTYLYRDPYAIIKSSTINRHFNVHVLPAIHLYTTMLQIIYGQLSRHPNKTLGCFGLLEPNVTNSNLWDPIRNVYGIQDKTKFEKYLQQIYKPPSSTSSATTTTTTATTQRQMKQQRSNIIPDNYRVYSDALIQVHNDVVELCRRQVQQQQQQQRQ